MGKEMATHSNILCWENPMDRGAWQATVHGVAKSQTQLSNFTSSTSSVNLEKIMFNLYLKKNVYSTNRLKISMRCNYSSSVLSQNLRNFFF